MNEDSNQLEGNVSNYFFIAMTGKGGKEFQITVNFDFNLITSVNKSLKFTTFVINNNYRRVFAAEEKTYIFFIST